ncbi:MAG: DNA-binding protein [Candidatus Woesearchaeota archaeon]
MNIERLFADKHYLETEISILQSQKQIRIIKENKELAFSHANKAKHNMRFYSINKIHTNFADWLIVILYYAFYHCALSLITNRRYYSKNHYATMLILIKEYLVTRDEADLLYELSINREDAQLYYDLKYDRHKASYNTNIGFRNDKILEYESKVIGFMNKTQEILLL